MKHKDELILNQLYNVKNKELAFKTLMDAYQRALYWHIRRLVVSHENTDDVLQETLVKIYFALDKFRGDSKLYTWLYSIATNECLQFLQKQKNKKKLNTEFDEYQENNLESQGSPNGDDLNRLLERAIKQLPEKQQMVFNLRYYDDLPYEEISKILNMSVGTCKTNYHYAKEKVTEYIKANSEEIQIN